jgi:excisionase family DNA binding protein
MKRSKTTARVVTVENGAAQLGLSPRTLRDWIWKREIEFIRVGLRAIRIRQSEIDRILEEGRVPAKASYR